MRTMGYDFNLEVRRLTLKEDNVFNYLKDYNCIYVDSGRSCIKLISQLAADSEVLEVTGLTLLMPRAGTMIAVSEEEGVRRTALLGLLDALEAQGMLDQVSSIRLESTQLYMRYLDRFDVKMLLNGDFSHLLWALDTAVVDLDQRVGPTCTGTLDLTSEQYQVIYSQS